MSASRSTTISRVIHASRDTVYRAFLNGEAVAVWLPPGNMTGVAHVFDAREGGTFRISLVYPEADSGRGKSSERTDTFQGRFAKLVPNEEIVWITQFESTDPAFAGEMTITTTLVPENDDAACTVTMICECIPPGIRLEDNEAGCRLTLEKLAKFVQIK